ncbi:S28 family serine protease [Streptomyces liangshanensis]|uniref:S28 family serine protease n=1 Tax=Streptomyces liangshanensis TaxID=2717324 RepID=UPI0036DEDD16
MRTTHRLPRRLALREALVVLALLAVPTLAGPLPGTVTPAAAAASEQPAAGDIRTRVEAVPGLRVIAERPAAPGYRFFELAYRQPVDHRHPANGTFEQRLTLLHRSTDRPMVLYTGGYDLITSPDFRAEPTLLVDGNQIVTEQRFFGESRPDPADWSKLDIWQAASDHHRLIQALKPLYDGRWVSAGVSKGGMASVYHRRFYPHDVDGTVVYSAPDNVDDRDDSAYDAFLARVGTPACRAALETVQRELLLRRDGMVARYEEWAAAQGRNFTVIGSADKAFELAVLRAVPMYWQYGAPDCAGVPAPTASTEDLYAWLDRTAGLANYTDETLVPLTPYFYQLGTQLGYPQYRTPHLADLLRHPGVQDVRTYVSRDIPLRFQPHAMADIDRWVRTEGSGLLFVYGENDAATAERFRLGPGSRDARVLVAPGTDHRARIASLAPEDATRATATVLRWAGR